MNHRIPCIIRIEKGRRHWPKEVDERFVALPAKGHTIQMALAPKDGDQPQETTLTVTENPHWKKVFRLGSASFPHKPVFIPVVTVIPSNK